MKESESNIKKEIGPEEVYRMYGIRAEVVEERLKNVFIEINKYLNEVAESFFKIIKNIDIDKYKKYIKYEKRVENRKKLYAKRKHKYGK